MSATRSSTNSHAPAKRLLAALWLVATTLAGCALFLWGWIKGSLGLYPDPTIAPPYSLLSGVVAALGPATIWFFTRKSLWLYAAGAFVLAGLVFAIIFAVAGLPPD